MERDVKTSSEAVDHPSVMATRETGQGLPDAGQDVGQRSARTSVRRRLLRGAAALLGLLLVALLGLWLALPGIVQSQAEQFVREKTAHQLSMAKPDIRLADLSVQLHDLKLRTPAGELLLGFDHLLIDLSAASLSDRALVFDAIRLDAPRLTLVELPDHAGLNWSPLLQALQGSEPPPAEKTALPRFDIRSFELVGGRVDFADRRQLPGFSVAVTPLDLSLNDISTLPDDSGKFSLRAKTSLGAELALAGALDLDPLTVSGQFDLNGLALERLTPYLQSALGEALKNAPPPTGTASLAAHYRVGNGGKQLDVTVEDVQLRVDALRLPLNGNGAAVAIARIQARDGRFELASQQLELAGLSLSEPRLILPGVERPVQLETAAIDGVQVNLAEQRVRIAGVRLAGGQWVVERTADGQLPLLAALQSLEQPREQPRESPSSTPAVSDSSANTAAPWRFQLERFEIAELAVQLRDAGITPVGVLDFNDINVQVADISQDLSVALPLKLALSVGSGGRFEADGRLAPVPLAADFKLKLTDLSLKPAAPYVAQHARVRFADGRISSQGQLSFTHQAPLYQGDFSLRDFRLEEVEAVDEKAVLLAWKNLATSQLKLNREGLDIAELRLNGLDTKLIIDKEKNINFKKVLVAKTSPAEVQPDVRPEVQPDVPDVVLARAAVPPAPTFRVNIDRLKFFNGAMWFADESLILPFGTRIHGLRGSVSHLSSVPGGAHGEVELEGEVDEFGMARAVGKLDLFNPTGFMDLRVLFRNVEMTRLTPYVATFAGRKIDSGKLTLDLQYQLKDRQLQGENQVIVERLKLGERVDSPTAKDLPLDLAIALLEDADGRIDLGLPVTGNLDDPQFSYGALVWKAISNVLTKIVTAPFRALGALLGGGEKIDSITFEAGATKLTPPEREKLVKLAGGLEKRPGLVLSLGASYAEADRHSLQEVQLRRTVLKQLGERVNEERDPGPLSTAQPKVRVALEALYAERIGAAELAALKTGFRQANPGILEENLAGKVMSRLSGLMREKKSLSEDQVNQLKGADFYAILYEQLRQREVVSDERLLALARARTEFAAATLKTAGLAVERLRFLDAEPVAEAAAEKSATTAGIPLRLSLDAAKEN